MISLNERLIETQNLSEEDVELIKETHESMQRFFEMLSSLDPEHHLDVIKQAPPVVEAFEFSLQTLWKFERDPKKHTWWYHTPHCKCPVIDNMENFGTELRIYSAACPLHGHNVTKINEVVEET